MRVSYRIIPPFRVLMAAAEAHRQGCKPASTRTFPNVCSPATWKHDWRKHGSSITSSKHYIPQDLYNPCLILMNSARTMFTPTMFSRRRVHCVFYFRLPRELSLNSWKNRAYRLTHTHTHTQTNKQDERSQSVNSNKAARSQEQRSHKRSNAKRQYTRFA